MAGIPPGGKYFFAIGAQYNHVKYDGYYENQPWQYTSGSWRFFMFHSLDTEVSIRIGLRTLCRRCHVLRADSRHRQLPLPRRPTAAARPLLAMDRQGQRQDHHSPAQRHPGGPLPGMDRQRPPTTRPAHPDARDRRRGHPTDHERSHEPPGQGLTAS